MLSWKIRKKINKNLEKSKKNISENYGETARLDKIEKMMKYFF